MTLNMPAFARRLASLSKDKALLKLAKRLAKAGMFKVMQPEKWSLDA